METVYLETTVVGSIAGRIHPHPDMAARQRKTRLWWKSASSQYHVVISQLVIDECSAGDPSAAQERLDEVSHLPKLEIADDSHDLANALMLGGAIPESEPRDALHIAIAATNGVEYLVTWNFKHIANATLRQRICDVCLANGFEPPVICTPEELGGMTDDA
ncbi:MAG: type II toxin-antitoxin system VapC family toxin [Lacipirellulaceae bacterium]